MGPQQQQPAAELIANALAKIKKLSGNKKHADLAQQCQQLIDSIQEVRLPSLNSLLSAHPLARAASLH
jgi:hypothetical protein